MWFKARQLNRNGGDELTNVTERGFQQQQTSPAMNSLGMLEHAYEGDNVDQGLQPLLKFRDETSSTSPVSPQAACAVHRH